MGSESSVTQTRSSSGTADGGAREAVGSTSRSAQLEAPRRPIGSALGTLSPEAMAALELLKQAEHDPQLRLSVIKRILEAATRAEPGIALQLLAVVEASVHEPSVAHVVAEVRQRIAAAPRNAHPDPTRASTTSAAAIADAQHFNLQHADNVAAFNAATDHSCAPGGVLDIELVVNWQRAHGLAADGKVGAGTLAAAHGTATASGKQSPTTTKAPHVESMEARRPGLMARQQQRRAELDAEDKDKPGHVDTQTRTYSRREAFQAISSRATTLDRNFRAMMTGHAFGEQGGSAPDYNFAGVEFNGNGQDTPWPNHAWTRAWRSDSITRAVYDADPERFCDWPANGTTIAGQLDANVKTLQVLWYSRRPVYASLAEAAGGFLAIIERQRKAFAGSSHKEHHDILAKADAGDVDAYLAIVQATHLPDWIKKLGQPEINKDLRGAYSYNPNVSYPSTVRGRIASAVADAQLNP